MFRTFLTITNFQVPPNIINSEDLQVMSIPANIFIGLVSGLLASAIVLVIALYWQKVIIPWFENRVYKGTRIAGTWQTTMIIDGEEYYEQAIIKQRAHRIWGTISYPKDTAGRSHIYTVQGEFLDRTLTLVMREVGESHQDLGAIVLDFKPGGSEPLMEGLGVWPVEGEIHAVPYRWKQI